jgi:5-methylcytosine-specific restriction enzyme subunit McrC
MLNITVREHEYLSFRDLGVKAESYQKSLEAIESTLPKGTFEWRHGSVKFKQYCGVLQINDLTIEILPKIAGLEADPAISREIFIRMLFSSQDLLYKPQGTASVKLQKHHLFDYFVKQFCDLLFEQVHKGMISTYIQESENLQTVKGKISLTEHLKINVAHKEKIFCVYDEFATDNSYNQAIKATLSVLYKKTRNLRLRQKVNELLIIFGNISDKFVTAKTVSTLPRNRLVDRFESIFVMCEWILSGYSPDMRAGTKKSYSLLFDMNKLFEGHIGKQLQKASKAFGLKTGLQRPLKYLANDLTAGKPVFLMKPDFSLMERDGSIALILDSKWKILRNSKSKYGVSEKDMYQMLAYASQYECKEVVLIYPKTGEILDASPRFITLVGDIGVSIWTIDLAKLATSSIATSKQLEKKLEQLFHMSKTA